MNRFSAAALCLILAGCGGPGGTTTGTGTTTPEKDVVFVSGALLIPGDGSAPIEEATMIIENGVITQVGKKKEFYAPKGAFVLELDGKTIAPLFVNLHAYPGLSNLGQFGAKNYNLESLSADIARYGYYGVGAVLAGGDSDGYAFQFRDEQRQGKASGAMLYTSGRGIAAKGSSGIMGSIPVLVSGDADARKAVGDLADRNVDAIVLWAEGMKADAASAVIDEAHKRKLKVFADAPSLAQAKTLVKADVDALISSVRDQEVDDEFIGLMKEKNKPISPALTALEARFMYTDKLPWLGEQAMREVYPAGLTAYLVDPTFVSQFRRNSQPKYREEFSTASKNLKKLSEAGVMIGFGSGSGLTDTFPGYFEHRELELMVRAGMSAADAIKAATSVSANALGAADLGVLAPGKKASFIVFSMNPLDDIKNSKQIDKVYVNGHDVDRQENIRKIKIVLPKITEEERATERKIQEDEARAAADAKLPHFGNGKFVLGKALSVAPGLTVQTPKYSQASKSGGPPYKVTVSMPKASGGDLKAFYAETLRATAAGDCWEKANPADGKKFRICPEPSSGQIILNISVQ